MLSVLFLSLARADPTGFTSAAEDQANMRSQLGITLPVLGDRGADYQKYILPKLKQYGSDVTFKQGSGNWDCATGTFTTWGGERMVGSCTITRTAWGLFNNYIQSWEPAGEYFVGTKWYKSLKVMDFTGVTSASWATRRAELFDAVQQTYGKIPAGADSVKISWSSIASGSGQYSITGTIKSATGYSARTAPLIRGTLRLPSGASSTKKAPIIVYIGGGIVDNDLWTAVSPSGVGAFYYYNTDLQPDGGGSAMSSYIIGLVNEGKWRKPLDWGALAAWAWGIGRLIDYFETDPTAPPVDPKKVGVTGHSRYGKATLVAMAYEQRAWIGFPSSSGKMGASPARRHVGEELENVCGDGSEYHWLAGNAMKFGGAHTTSDGYMPRNVLDMPGDAEALVALCAPRPLFLGSGKPSSGEAWADPYGIYLAGQNGTPAYKVLGLKGLVMTDTMSYKGQAIPMPTIGKAYIEGTIGYRNHGGGHVQSPNYPAFASFMKKYL